MLIAMSFNQAKLLSKLIFKQNVRFFSPIHLNTTFSEADSQKFGSDKELDTNKHKYIFEFPWFEENLLKNFESKEKSIPNYWKMFLNNRGCYNDFSFLYRELHQWFALKDYNGIKYLCEGKLSNKLTNILKEITRNGFDLEMTDISNQQPNLKILEVEAFKNIEIEREKNFNYNSELREGRLWGFGPQIFFAQPHNKNEDIIDWIQDDYKPYLVSVTVLFNSKMRLLLYNQDRTKILKGEKSEDTGKNIVKFEIKLKPWEFFRILPVDNKPPLRRNWIITDFNYILKGNDYFK